MNKFVIVDLETTGQAPLKGDCVIEIGIVVVEEGKITEHFSSLFNPNIPIPAFITNLTGIKDEDVQDAPQFEQLAPKIASFFDDAYFVAHNVAFDLSFLNQELKQAGIKPLSQPILDTVELARILLPQVEGYKLSQLSDFFSLQHNDPHRALSDAYVTAKLLLLLMDKLEQLPYETIFQLQKWESKFKSDLFHLFNQRLDRLAFQPVDRKDLEVYRGIALKKQLKSNEIEVNDKIPTIGTLFDDLFHTNGKLETVIDHYEERKGQREMSETVYDSFQSKQHALIEAETGTGKSLAYLLPAIYQAVKHQDRVVVSTHLTQLQTQLLDKEIPVIKQLLPFPFKSALMKGKKNYLSLAKFEIELFLQNDENYDITLTKAIILVWLTETLTGDIDELQLPSSGKFFFNKVSAEAEGELDPNSSWFSRSFYQRVRSNAQKANLIITNHALICSDIASDYSIIPSYKKLIIDEAHQFESTVTKQFGLKIDYVHIQFILNHLGTLQTDNWIYRICKKNKQITNTITEIKWEQLWQDAKVESDKLFSLIFSYVTEQKQKDINLNDTGRYQYRLTSKESNNFTWQSIKEMVMRLLFNLRDMIHALTKVRLVLKKYDTSELDEVDENIERVQKIIDNLEEVFLLEDNLHVKWVEVEALGAKNAVYLYSEPFDISLRLKEQLFEQKESVVLTSATLTMKQSFEHIKARLGLSDIEINQVKIESPFSYQDQVQLLVPNDFPTIKFGKQDDFVFATCEAIYSLAEVTDGRMLVLFTSYDMLRKCYYMLKEIMVNDSYIIIAQGISSGSRERLKKNFQSFDRAILLGTNSFWEGVDIPGKDLSCLMIVKLPFEPPNNPVFEAKSQFLKQQGKNPFMDLSLPNAVIRFKQGFGRLIRSSTDRGIVFVCDDRIITKKYGTYFTESIPAVPITYNTTQKLIEKTQNWL